MSKPSPKRPSSTPPRQGRPRADGRVDALATTAAEMILAGGYDALSLDELIERVGGSRRNIYSHFGGKEGLFIEVVTQLCQEIGEPLRRLRIEDTKEAPEVALRLFGSELLRLVLGPRTLALHRLMVAEGARFPKLAEAIWRSGHESAYRLLAEWITRQQATGGLRPGGDPSRLAAQFVDMVTAGAQLRSLIGVRALHPTPDEIAAIVADAVESFLEGRRVRSSQAAVHPHPSATGENR
jgi:AcrR family transcriptional regulator